MNQIKSLLVLSVLTSLFLGNSVLAQEKSLACEIIDHTRGIKIHTFSDDWTITVSKRNGIHLEYSPLSSRVNINQEFISRKTVAETIAYQLRITKEAKHTQNLSEDFTLNVGGIEAKGISYFDGYSKASFAKAWFKKDGKSFDVVIRSTEKNYDEFMKTCQATLDAIKFFEPDNVAVKK